MVGQTSPASTFFVNEFFFPSEKLKQTKYSFYIYLTGPINLQLSFSAYLKDFHSLGSYILILHCYSKLSKRKKRKKGQGEEEEKDETWWPLQGEKGEVDLQSLKVQVCELVVEVSSSRFFSSFFPAWPTLMKLQILTASIQPPSSAPTWTPFTKRRGFLLLDLFLQHWGNQTVEHAEGDETF